MNDAYYERHNDGNGAGSRDRCGQRLVIQSEAGWIGGQSDRKSTALR